jgi:hypothetical protein
VFPNNSFTGRYLSYVQNVKILNLQYQDLVRGPSGSVLLIPKKGHEEIIVEANFSR